MAIYDGIVTLADQEVPVMVELGGEHVRMSASGTEIGHWPADQCEITHVEDVVYSITAENETLRFVPNQPSLFAAAVNGVSELPPAEASPPAAKEAVVESQGSSSGHREAPPPKPLTMGLFYALCLATAALAGWALISIIF